MVKPQQPEVRRSDRGATSDDAAKGRLTAPGVPGIAAAGGPVPEGNQPGHRPTREQDKPRGPDFVAKMHALAGDDAYDPPSTDNEVLDLTQVDADRMHDGARPREHSSRGEVRANLAGKPFALAGAALSAVRKRLPDG